MCSSALGGKRDQADLFLVSLGKISRTHNNPKEGQKRATDNPPFVPDPTWNKVRPAHFHHEGGEDVCE